MSNNSNIMQNTWKSPSSFFHAHIGPWLIIYLLIFFESRNHELLIAQSPSLPFMSVKIHAQLYRWARQACLSTTDHWWDFSMKKQVSKWWKLGLELMTWKLIALIITSFSNRYAGRGLWIVSEKHFQGKSRIEIEKITMLVSNLI
jgi:hypothetical protein